MVYLPVSYPLIPLPLNAVGAAALSRRRLVLLGLPATLLPVPFASQRLLDPQFLARLQVEGVAFHFFDDVLLLHFSLEAAKGVF